MLWPPGIFEPKKYNSINHGCVASGIFLNGHTSAAMPQHCSGLQDPCGGPARRCMFARSGDGGTAEVKKQRDGDRCAFCCPEAWARAWASRIGKGRITKRLAAWLKASSPVYEAAFSMGCPGLLLTEDEQAWLRRKAGQAPPFSKKISWAHRKLSRLQHLRRGRPIPPAPPLTDAARSFMEVCKDRNSSRRRAANSWAKISAVRQDVQRYYRLREADRKLFACPQQRRAWWRARRNLRGHFLEAARAGAPYNAAVLWAIEEGIVVGDMPGKNAQPNAPPM